MLFSLLLLHKYILNIVTPPQFAVVVKPQPPTTPPPDYESCPSSFGNIYYIYLLCRMLQK